MIYSEWDRVALCANEKELRQAFQTMVGLRGREGCVVQDIVVQGFLQGTEYIVDAVSFQGHHKITDIWRYQRLAVNGAPFVYDTKELVPFAGQVQEQLMAYTKAALDAVELRHGPSHNEIMMTATGPVLVEINARFGGSMGPIINRKCLGHGQLEAMLDVLFAPEKFLETCNAPYFIEKHGLAVYLIAQSDEVCVNAEVFERIKAYPSFSEAGLANPPGTRLRKSVDMSTMPGMVELVREDQRQIRLDYECIRQLEVFGGLYIAS